MRVYTSLAALRQAITVPTGRAIENAPAVTGLGPLDALLPRGGFAMGAIHEVLSAATTSLLLPLLIAKAATTNGRWVVWLDDDRHPLYPPSVASRGLPLDRLLVVRAGNRKDAVWIATECLRCDGVGACVAEMPRLSQVEARRLQLAAECGGGIGVLVRPIAAASEHYAAATRWVVRPVPGDLEWRRSEARLIHCHGGRG